MAQKPYKLCRQHSYRDRNGETQKKWKDTGIVAWESDRGGFRLDVPCAVILSPNDNLMLFPPSDRDDDRGGRSSKYDRDDHGSGGGSNELPPPTTEDEPLYDDDIPF